MAEATERDFAGEPTAPAEARRFALHAVQRLLAHRSSDMPEDLCDDVQLVVSELVTNAVRAGSPTVRVTVTLTDQPGSERIVVRVRDAAPGWPEARSAGLTDTGGRGLPLVSAVSASWGVRMAGDGKMVWAELEVPAPF